MKKNTAMTLSMISMRTEGYGFGEIAAHFGVSKATAIRRVKTLCKGVCETKCQEPRINIIYPAIGKWMRENNVSVYDFASKSGIDIASCYNILSGRTEPRKTNIDRILAVTGGKYETTFTRG